MNWCECQTQINQLGRQTQKLPKISIFLFQSSLIMNHIQNLTDTLQKTTKIENLNQ